MVNDLPIILSWWLIFFSLGIIFLPLTLKLFPSFFDRGYAFSKILGVLSLSYVVWLLGSLKILSFNTPNISLVILIFTLLSFLCCCIYRKNLVQELRTNWKIFLFEEFLFLLALAFWSFIRGLQPDIEGLEKFMDFGFINSLLRSEYFPPADMWMAGKTINYYYFGHLVAAVLTKISGFDSTITYNLMIATVFALAFTATFSLGANLLFLNFGNSNLFRISKKFHRPLDCGFRIFIGGLLSAGLLTLGGNLHPLYWFITHNFSFTGYWYPDATRFIVEKFGALDNTIHEFPLYSFVVSDLHGHVSDIPFVLLFLAVLFSFLTSKSNFQFPISNFQLTLLPALILATMYMTNSWDFPIYFMILGLVVLWKNYQEFGSSIKTVKNSMFFGLLVFLFFSLFSFPFHLNFTQIAQGIALVNAHTPLWMLPVLWGFPWFLIFCFLIYCLKAFVIPLKKGIYCEASSSAYIDPRIREDDMVRGNDLSKFQFLTSDIFILILSAVATLLIIIPEFLYVKDIYIASYHRANTMFKLTYQSFMLYSITGGYIIIRILTSLRRKIFNFLFVFFIFNLLFFIFVYPNYAIKSYYGDLQSSRYQGLWGLKFMERSYPDNLIAINWLNKNVSGQPTILEAVGDSYTQYNQISMATGLPTVEGWLVHEWLWRGSFDEPGKRASEVQLIYETQDLDIAQTYLQKYQVKYVILGNQEREKYKVTEEKFEKLGKIIFQSGDTKIYVLY